jgi:ribonuclease VapC
MATCSTTSAGCLHDRRYLHARRDHPRRTGRAAVRERLATSQRSHISAANYVEAAIVVDSSRDPVASRRFDELMRAAGITVVPVTAEQAEVARAAYRDFGEGSGHRAGRNFGDCFAYALATTSGEPLLYKGNDFSHTDVTAADTMNGPQDT